MFVMWLEANASLCGLFCHSRQSRLPWQPRRCSDFRFTFVHVEKPKSSRQVVFLLFLKVDNKSCHPQKEKYSNIILNEDADASNQPVNIDLNGRSVCARAPDDTRTCTFHV